MGEIKKIVTHLPPNHVDELLALALLLQKYKNVDVEFLDNKDSLLEKYKKDKSVILVDIGNEYNPSYRNYDHHHDISISSSLVLVLKHEFKEYYNLIEKDKDLKRQIDYIDLKDRFGKKIAKKLTKLSGLDFLEEVIGSFSVEDLERLGKYIVGYFERIKKAYKNLEKLKIKKIKEILIGIDRNYIKPHLVFRKYKVDILVATNIKNKNRTSIIKNPYSSFDMGILEKYYRKEIEFIHKTKFLMIVNKKLDKVVEEIEKILGGEKWI